MRTAWPADWTGRSILAASALLGAAYLLDGAGLGPAYPFDVALKASGIVLLAVFAATRGAWILAAGLAAGSVGDAMLALQPPNMPAGIAAFGIGHLIYLGLFIAILRARGVRRAGWPAAAALAVFGVAALLWLGPAMGELRVPASIYNGVILAMAIAAVLSRAHGLAIAGAVLFVVSDAVLAVRLFMDALPWAGFVVWVTYYLAQLSLALGLSMKSERASPQPGL